MLWYCVLEITLTYTEGHNIVIMKGCSFFSYQLNYYHKFIDNVKHITLTQTHLYIEIISTGWDYRNINKILHLDKIKIKVTQG